MDPSATELPFPIQVETYRIYRYNHDILDCFMQQLNSVCVWATKQDDLEHKLFTMDACKQNVKDF